MAVKKIKSRTKAAVIKSVRERVVQIYKKLKGAHDLEHTERVLALALRIARSEKADPYIVELACWVHDISRRDEDLSRGETDHAEEGAKRAVPLLLDSGAKNEEAAAVAACVRSHRFRGMVKPESIEAKVLFDADKLDSMGAVGIGRAFQFAGEIGAKIHNPDLNIEKSRPYTDEDTAYREYMVKLRFLKDRMMTVTGKKLAVKRHAIMEDFFRELNLEVRGEV